MEDKSIKPELNEAIAACYIELGDYNSAITVYKKVLENH